MTNAELVDAISVTHSRCKTGNAGGYLSSPLKPPTEVEVLMLEHLKALLAIQLERAKPPPFEDAR